MQQVLQGGVSLNVENTLANTTESILNTVRKSNPFSTMIKTALFMEAMRNVSWSRAYDWYCELDGVPNPFHRGGVLGLPATDVNIIVATGKEFSFNAPSTHVAIPQRHDLNAQVDLTMLDDEQGTLAQFFERWLNQIYNPYAGVLPLEEACKCLTLYRQKASRKNLKRVYYNIDTIISKTAGLVTSVANNLIPKITEGIDLLIFPKDSLTLGYNYNNELNTIRMSFVIADVMTQDFGDPTKNSGVLNAGDDIHIGSSWLDKLADYV